jgi:hypothetical protein
MLQCYYDAMDNSSSDTRSPRRHRPAQVPLLLRLLHHGQHTLLPQLSQILLAKLVPDLVDLLELSELERAVFFDGWTHVPTSRRDLCAFQVVVAADVRKTGLDFRKRGRVGIG